MAEIVTWTNPRDSITPLSNPWRKFVMYQLYPQSFQDTNGDGIGDLAGVEKRLDYLTDLGVNAVWFNPIFRSPFKDAGYDVQDYREVDPRYGTTKQFLSLVESMHSHGIKVFIDCVINHTSDQHPWFLESRSSRINPKRNWYIWRDGKPGGSPPNNWIADFGGEAWKYDRLTNQYYLHSFLPHQPDLNYQNPRVKRAIAQEIKFWLDNGIDGIRLDALPFVAKHPDMPDEPLNPDYRHGDHPFKKLKHPYTTFQPEMLEVLTYFTDMIAQDYPHTLVISEAWPGKDIDSSWIDKLIHASSGKIHAPFNFGPVGTPWNSTDFPRFVADFYPKLSKEEITVWTLGSHDVPRLADRIDEEQLKIAAMWLLTMPQSMPVIYQGDELGLKGQPINPNLPTNAFYLVDPTTSRTKDGARLPLPWTNEINAGFTTGVPWLPIPNDYQNMNIATQLRDPNSLLNLYKRLIQHRKNSRIITDGELESIKSDGNVVVFTVSTDSAKEEIALNFSNLPQQIIIPETSVRVLSTINDSMSENSNLTLRPHEGVIFAIH